MPVPSWADNVIVTCQGLADTMLRRDGLLERVNVPPGRPLTITIRSADGKPTNAEARLELKHANGKYTSTNDVTIGGAFAPGSIALGVYTIRISSAENGTIADSFILEPGESRLELAYAVHPGCCLPLTVSSTEFTAMPNLAFGLYLLSETRPPRLQEEGTLALQPEGPGRWAGKICNLPQGRYEITLRADGAVPESRVLDVQPGTHQPEAFSLVRGICNYLDVFSANGPPVSNAQVIVRWSTPQGPQSAAITTDEQGRAQLPCLPSGATIRAYIIADGFVPASVEGMCGQQHMVVLKEEGTITATLTGSCTPDDPEQGITVEVAWEATDQPAQGHESIKPNDCLLRVPVKHPGNYQMRITAPDLKPLRKTVTLTEDLNVDLGDIELERGNPLIIKVTHHGQAVAGAAVRLSRDGQPKITDTDGIVQFGVLDDATRTAEVFITHPEYASRRVVVQLEGRGREHVVALWKGGAVFGRVLNEDGSSAVGETLIAEGSENLTTTVDGQGHYEFTRLDPGRWRVVRLRMFGEGRAANTMGTGDFRTVDLQDGELAELDFVKTADVQGTVYIDGNLAGRVTIGAVHASWLGPTSATLTVDANGQYFGRLPMTGDWTFYWGRSTYVARIINCPCIVDLHFSKGTPGSPDSH